MTRLSGYGAGFTRNAFSRGAFNTGRGVPTRRRKRHAYRGK